MSLSDIIFIVFVYAIVICAIVIWVGGHRTPRRKKEKRAEGKNHDSEQ